jgi:murein DD-endopeptidase MepM/ murein hydrolase activator NlpD
VIVLSHPNGLITIYKHNKELLKKVGKFVKVGELIAILGSTGEYTSGPHLHFEMWFKGVSLNPTDFFNY